MATDPVCGMEFEATSASPATEYQDRRIYFCSNACLREFEADPEIWQPAFEPSCRTPQAARELAKS